MLAALAFAAAVACAQDSVPSGRAVYEAVCASCHETGAQGAPMTGNRAAWTARASQGLDVLTRQALDGIRNMPPHGGDTTLSDLELRRATVYMVNQSGGNWAEPREPGAPAGNRSGEQVVKQACATCHETGFGGAPRVGDRAAWNQRLVLGIDRAVRSAMRGYRDMPPRGGLADLNEAEIRSAIIYMATPARRKPAPDRKQ
jgi:cytochrome c5